MKFEIDELPFRKVCGRNEEWKASLVVLDMSASCPIGKREKVTERRAFPSSMGMIEGGWHHRRGNLIRTYLGSNEEIPTLDEMSTDIPGWLTDNLHSDVVPTIISLGPHTL